MEETTMADAPAGFKMRLDPQDEYPHKVESAKNYNESMYFNMFDPDKKIGGWFRIGNRPNENYAEMTVCLYLPGKRAAFMFRRAEITGNTEMNAGGLKIEIIEPFKKLKLTYRGKMLLMDDPSDMADPSTAFKKNPSLPSEIDLEFVGVSPVSGGEMVKDDGSALELDPEKTFLRGHYEQHMEATGSFKVGDEKFDVHGYGLRDKSWGPRYWQAVSWYRWCPMNFGKDFGLMLSINVGPDGKARGGGVMLKDGKYERLASVDMKSEYDKNYSQTSLRADVTTLSGEKFEVTGEVISLVPLRNRRTSPDGVEMMTRITEGFTEYKAKGMVGYGLSEYLDQMVDGVPISIKQGVG
jgi:hypothetical protein